MHYVVVSEKNIEIIYLMGFVMFEKKEVIVKIPSNVVYLIKINPLFATN